MSRNAYMKQGCMLMVMNLLVTSAMGADPGGNAGPLCLWYDQPATSWMTEALPIGNGPMGAMLFGGTDIERIQFNEISLWSGDRMPRPDDIEEENRGAHQAFGDVFIRLGHDPAKVIHYRRKLDIDRAVHRVAYEYEGVRYQQSAFASHPAHVIVIHLTADKPGAYTGRVWLTDIHGAQIKLAENRLSSVGKLGNGFEYEAQVQVLHQGGETKRSAPENPGITPMSPLGLSFTKCDAVTLILGATAGTCEMLVQSHAGQIQLLPALPSAWSTGAVTGLCARGGFEVDISRKDGQLTGAVIRSKSAHPCRVTYGSKTWEAVTAIGEAYHLGPNLKVIAKGMMVWTTKNDV